MFIFFLLSNFVVRFVYIAKNMIGYTLKLFNTLRKIASYVCVQQLNQQKKGKKNKHLKRMHREAEAIQARKKALHYVQHLYERKARVAKTNFTAHKKKMKNNNNKK